MGIKPSWKLRLLFVAALVMVALLVGACGDTKEKPTISFYDGSWESLWISNAIGQYIIEEGYGYPTEAIVLDTPVMQISIANGDLLVSLEHWKANIVQWHEDEIAAGNIIEYAAILEGGPQFFIIPQWVHEEYGIDTLEDMKENWELFRDPEDSSKGYFINCKIGWQCAEINRVKMETYGMTDNFNIMSAGSSGAMVAAYVGAMTKHEPIFGYYWAPTSLMGMYDWYIFPEPEYDADVWADVLEAKDDPTIKLDAATEYESLPLTIVTHKSLSEIAPDLVDIFEKMVIGLPAMNKLAAWSQNNEISDYTETAIYYLENYESTWKTWITTDAFDKVKAALAEE